MVVFNNVLSNTFTKNLYKTGILFYTASTFEYVAVTHSTGRHYLAHILQFMRKKIV